MHGKEEDVGKHRKECGCAEKRVWGGRENMGGEMRTRARVRRALRADFITSYMRFANARWRSRTSRS